jgi:2-dehydropantoate 2-reductase
VRERRAERLRQCGLKVKSPEGDLAFACPPMVLAKDIDQPYDLVLLSCKAYDLQGAIDSFAPAVGPNTAILPLLNGMGHLDALDARFDPANVLGGQCVIAATLDAEGEILHLNNMHSMTIGERGGGRSARIDAIAAQLGGAGFDLNVSEDILQSMWDKWDILAAPGGEALLVQLFDECSGIAADNAHAPGEPVVARARAFFSERGSLMTASMLRDLENGAPIEADHIVGDLLARRRTAVGGVSALAVAYAHLKAYEARRTRMARA